MLAYGEGSPGFYSQGHFFTKVPHKYFSTWGGGAAKHRDSILASHPAARVLINSLPKKYLEEKIIDVAELNQWLWLEERGQ